jgi:hypothetical protein
MQTRRLSLPQESCKREAHPLDYDGSYGGPATLEGGVQKGTEQGDPLGHEHRQGDCRINVPTYRNTTTSQSQTLEVNLTPGLSEGMGGGGSG